VYATHTPRPTYTECLQEASDNHFQVRHSDGIRSFPLSDAYVGLKIHRYIFLSKRMKQISPYTKV
jgi:hypothetical protein